MAGSPIVADTRGLERLARDLKAASPASYKAAKKGLRVAAGGVLATAKSNASFSTRIQDSGHIEVTSGLVVRVVFGGAAAPEAAPIENDGRGFVRHPTFSPRPAVEEKVGWTSKNSHGPWLEPARASEAAAAAELVYGVVFKAVEDSLR